MEEHKLFKAEESMVYSRVRDSGGFSAKRRRLPSHLKGLLKKEEDRDEGVGSIYGRCITYIMLVKKRGDYFKRLTSWSVNPMHLSFV